MDSEKELRVKRSLEKHIPLNMIKSLQKVDDTFIRAVKEKYHIKIADKREAVWRMSGRGITSLEYRQSLSNTKT